MNDATKGYSGSDLQFLTARELAERSNQALTFAAFSVVNGARCNRWHAGGLAEWSVTDWSNAVAGELGEACNAIKKLRRIETGAQNINDPGRQLTERDQAIAAIGAEIADTFIYLDLLAQRLGLSLEAEVVKKFNATSERYGFPERLP
jgi:NTP pyrophosphatase (non-canonical NTP hydrolase)